MTAVAARMARLRQAMAEAEVAALLISQPESRRYLSGYDASDLPPRDSAGYLLVTEDRQYLLTDPRTEGHARAQSPDFEVVVYSGGMRMSELLRQLISHPHLKHLCFEGGHLSYGVWEDVKAAIEDVATLSPSPPLVDRLRMVKDPQEVAAMRASIALNDAALAHLAHRVEPGMAEQDLAWEVESFLRTKGAEAVAFPPITVGGPNTAIPHAVPADRGIQRGELLLFDIGAKLGGYCSDMTRTICIDSLPPSLRKMWEVVLEAQLAAEASVRPGMTGAQVDAIARNVIEDAGYGEAFVHSLGHGIGLEVHEPPWLSKTRGDDVLEPGMVFSIEPGVYLPGVGGVRIEDLVLMTDRGAEVLSASPKKLELSEVLLDLDG